MINSKKRVVALYAGRKTSWDTIFDATTEALYEGDRVNVFTRAADSVQLLYSVFWTGRSFMFIEVTGRATGLRPDMAGVIEAARLATAKAWV